MGLYAQTLRRFLVAAAAFVAFAAVAALTTLSGSAAASTADVDYTLGDGWEYHWGDPAGVAPADLAAWADGSGDSYWQPFDVRRPPPGRGDHRVVWYRVSLPKALTINTSMFIPGAYQLFQVAVAGRMVYKWGEFSEEGAERFLGSPFHIVPLPLEGGGRHLYLRIYSTFKNIGITGAMRLGHPASHLRYVVAKDLPRVILGALFMFIGVFQLFLFRRRDAHVAPYLAFGSFAFLYGLHGIARTQLRDLIVYAPLAWKYTEVLTVFLLPIGLLRFVEDVFGAGYPSHPSLVRRLRHLNIASMVVLIPISAYDTEVLEHVLSVYHYLFMPALGFLIVGALWQARRGDREAAIFAAGLGIIIVPAGIDGFVVSGALPWIEPISSWGVLGFVCTLQVILSRKLSAERRRSFVLEREIETAGVLSSTFLPAPSAQHPAYKIDVVFRPAATLGGDWFAYYLYQERYLHVHIGDVTGHGPAAALTAAFAKGATDMLYSKLAGDGDPDVPLTALHGNLNALLGRATGTLMTLFSVAIDLDSGRMEYINSGHMVQFVCSPSAATDAVLTGHGRSLLGFAPELPRGGADRLALRGDEVLFLFSDGLIEALGRDGGRGVKDLFELLKRGVRRDPASLKAEVLALLDGAKSADAADDITFVMVSLSLAAAGLARRAPNSLGLAAAGSL